MLNVLWYEIIPEAATEQWRQTGEKDISTI